MGALFNATTLCINCSLGGMGYGSFFTESRLGRCKACNGYPVGGTGNVVQTDIMAEMHRGRFPAMFSAYSDLKIDPCFSSTFRTHAYKLSDAFPVKDLERIIRKNSVSYIKR